MNDYTLTKDEKNSFILNYNILKKSNYIRINLACGDSYLIPYTIDNEKKILEVMKKQVINSKTYLNNEEIKSFFTRMGALIIGATTVTFNSFLATKGFDPDALYVNIPLILSELFLLAKSKSYKNNIENVKMHKTFIELEDKINKYIKITNNIFTGTSNKTKFAFNNPDKDIKEYKKVKDIYKDILYKQNGTFNINSIGNITYRDFNKIVENIKFEEKLQFDYNKKELLK